jgi:outer membrane receptor for ferrienterochelin and colicin
MKKVFLLLLLILFVIPALPQEKYTLSGYVSDEHGEMLTGVYILIPGTTLGTVTNNYGFYSLTLPKGNYLIRFSFVGYKLKELQIDLVNSQKYTLSLEPETSSIDAVTITAEKKDKNIKDATMSTVELPARIIKKIPNLMGEVDIIKSIQLLPGVQSSVEGSSGFYVRGGNSDQNLILLDGATVYNASHLFGFFSVFNGDAVKNIELFKGGIPAEYGGRMSSVLDVRMNEGNTQKIKGNAGIGMISSRLTLEGPIIKDKLSFIVSGRRTYADLMLPFAKDTMAKDSKVYFYDLNAKINYQVNQNNRIFLSGYFGRDINSFANLYEMIYGNATGTMRWNHIYADKLFSNLTLIFSNFNYNMGTPNGVLGYKWISNIIDYSIHNDYTYYISPTNTLKFGLQATYHTIKPGSIKSTGSNSFISEVDYPDNHSIESAVFASNEQKIGSHLVIVYGLRFSMFQNIGRGIIYHYDSNHELLDSTVYESGHIFNTRTSFEPRLNIVYTVSDKSSVKFSYNRTVQYLQLASNSTASFPLDMWFMSNPNIKPQRADQIAAGYFRNFKENTIEASLEVFYKEIHNSIDFKDHAILMPQQYLDGELRTGKAHSYGAELLVRKQSGRFTGWVSYTYIRTYRQIPAINKGKAYPPPYDKPHNISLVFNYEISKRFDAGFNWIYSSPMPVTIPRSGYYYGNAWMPGSFERGGTRIQGTAYHRLDLSVNYYFKTFKRESSLNLSIYNVYNRHNAFAVYFRDKNFSYDSPGGEKGIEVVKLYLFPIIPAITYNIKF